MRISKQKVAVLVLGSIDLPTASIRGINGKIAIIGMVKEKVVDNTSGVWR